MIISFLSFIMNTLLYVAINLHGQIHTKFNIRKHNTELKGNSPYGKILVLIIRKFC